MRKPLFRATTVHAIIERKKLLRIQSVKLSAINPDIQLNTGNKKGRISDTTLLFLLQLCT